MTFWVALAVLHLVAVVGICGWVCQYLKREVRAVQALDRCLPSAVRFKQAPPWTRAELALRCGIGIGLGLAVWTITATPGVGVVVALCAVGLELVQFLRRPMEWA